MKYPVRMEEVVVVARWALRRVEVWRWSDYCEVISQINKWIMIESSRGWMES